MRQLDLSRPNTWPAVMTVPEVAQALRVGRHTAYRMAEEGLIPLRPWPTRKLVAREDVIRMLEARAPVLRVMETERKTG
jgi:excisionase family DNA binding protein